MAGDAPKPTYPCDAVPANYASLSEGEKINWLDKQGFPKDPTINLGDCYRRGAKLTRIFRLVRAILRRISDFVVGKVSGTVKKALFAFFSAFNDSVGRLSNDIFQNVTTLHDTGKFGDITKPLTPVAIPDLPTSDDEDTVKTLPANDKAFKDTFWGIFVDTLNLLVDKWAWLSDVQPGMDVSYKELIKRVVGAGQTFWVAYQKEGGDAPSDEEHAFVLVVVISALENGRQRRLEGWKHDSANGVGDDDQVPQLEVAPELPWVWPRVLLE